MGVIVRLGQLTDVVALVAVLGEGHRVLPQEDLQVPGLQGGGEILDAGYVAETVDKLTAAGYTYEKEGALWLATSRILEENARKAGKSEKDIAKLDLKDDVLRRANGFYTYFAADIAYHRNKFEERGFDKVINIWGADHHGHVARLKGAMDALGLDGANRLDIVLMQLVKLLRDGEVVRMSKRTGKAISLTDLLDEVPVDAARWFFNAKPDTQMDFDLGLAVREDSENPIYYVEYAHARICSLLRNLAAEGQAVPAMADIDPALLSGETETALIKQLSLFCEELRLAARDYDPSHLNRYLVDPWKAKFHGAVFRIRRQRMRGGTMFRPFSSIRQAPREQA